MVLALFGHRIIYFYDALLGRNMVIYIYDVKFLDTCLPNFQDKNINNFPHVLYTRKCGLKNSKFAMNLEVACS